MTREPATESTTAPAIIRLSRLALRMSVGSGAASIRPSAAERVRQRAPNHVTKPETLDFRTMLPERLSNGVCSLNPNVVRLTHSVFIRFAKNGAPRSARFARTMIQSTRRLTYQEAFAILQTPPDNELRFYPNSSPTNEAA